MFPLFLLMTLEVLFINLLLAKETFSVIFFCGQDCCFVPVYYMVQGDGALTMSRLFGSLILDCSLVFLKSQFQILFSLADVKKKIGASIFVGTAALKYPKKFSSRGNATFKKQFQFISNIKLDRC